MILCLKCIYSIKIVNCLEINVLIKKIEPKLLKFEKENKAFSLNNKN